jgi:hypothetical protein
VTEATLKYVSVMMESLGIPYEFMRWNSGIPPDAYFVGEYIESPSMTKEESGFQETTFILRGFTRQSWLLLEQAKAKIEANVAKTAILDDGTGIAVFYESASPVPTGDAELKSIKIDLKIQEWKVK